MQRNDPTFERGYFTFAKNTDAVNYLEIAYLQALSIKCTQNINDYAIAVDDTTLELIKDKHKQVFDHIILIPEPSDEIYGDEWKAWYLTPFRETIKLDADILFTRNIDHWWTGLQQNEVVCTTDVRDYKGNISNSTKYRNVFIKN